MDDMSGMGDVLVVPCYVCGMLLQLHTREPDDLAYFHNNFGAWCGNPNRLDFETEPGCSTP